MASSPTTSFASSPGPALVPGRQRRVTLQKKKSTSSTGEVTLVSDNVTLVNGKPLSTAMAAQYWSARALRAEMLLETQANHHTQLQELARAENVIMHYYDRVIMILVAVVLILFTVVICFAVQRKPERNRSFAHFTIPVLSPFASVIEHETSVIGSKTISLFVVCFCVLIYAVFRHWASRPR
ncbi:hypothetical protein FISHEDRAFT_57981 [Fistulina hepatica ATCC 64428]|uniref:Uncharacterized protein n=1 Tax=Fistulina hepatica ATCC 64428 TaxID=1128425 RepID=A0A0D7AE67_9AGAR|nr:hypothetical protein FISHEDRAFT_57981 [Fistulina hepatica ATCC 64428]